MHLVVLDGYTLNPGDLSWERFERIGPIEVYDRTEPEDIVARAKDAEIVITNKTILGAKEIEQLPQARYIGVLATGYNVVDILAATKHGIAVANVPNYSTESVAQMTFAHLLNLSFRVTEHAQAVSRGDWNLAEDFCFWNFPLVELSGKTIGIVGLGQIGQAVARIALAIGMNVIAHVRTPRTPPAGIKLVSLDELFALADVVTLHTPLTPETMRLVDRERLARMKPGAWLINTSRGPLVDEAALDEALRSGRLGGAGLDVLSSEPPSEISPLYSAPNCYITPHIAWATKSARARLLDVAADNVAAFVAGKPQNVVNRP